MLVISADIAIPEEELTWTFARAGGPGGQNVNKVASKALLRWSLSENHSVPAAVKQRLLARHPQAATQNGDFLVVSSEYRDQERNRERCRAKLAAWLQAALVPPKPRIATRPTRSSQERRIAAKKKTSSLKSRRRESTWDE